MATLSVGLLRSDAGTLRHPKPRGPQEVSPEAFSASKKKRAPRDNSQKKSSFQTRPGKLAVMVWAFLCVLLLWAPSFSNNVSAPAPVARRLWTTWCIGTSNKGGYPVI